MVVFFLFLFVRSFVLRWITNEHEQIEQEVNLTKYIYYYYDYDFNPIWYMTFMIRITNFFFHLLSCWWCCFSLYVWFHLMNKNLIVFTWARRMVLKWLWFRSRFQNIYKTYNYIGSVGEQGKSNSFSCFRRGYGIPLVLS